MDEVLLFLQNYERPIIGIVGLMTCAILMFIICYDAECKARRKRGLTPPRKTVE